MADVFEDDIPMCRRIQMVWIVSGRKKERAED